MVTSLLLSSICQLGVIVPVEVTRSTSARVRFYEAGLGSFVEEPQAQGPFNGEWSQSFQPQVGSLGSNFARAESSQNSGIFFDRIFFQANVSVARRSAGSFGFSNASGRSDSTFDVTFDLTEAHSVAFNAAVSPFPPLGGAINGAGIYVYLYAVAGDNLQALAVAVDPEYDSAGALVRNFQATLSPGRYRILAGCSVLAEGPTQNSNVHSAAGFANASFTIVPAPGFAALFAVAAIFNRRNRTFCTSSCGGDTAL